MISYLKYRIWDWLICTAISVGLVFHVYSGFELEDGLSGSIPAVVVVVCFLSAVYVLLSYSRKSMVFGIVAGIALLIIFIVYAQGVNPFSDETANSLCIAWVAAILTSLLAYLATRSRPGTVVLLVAGNFVVAGSHFLQFTDVFWPAFVFWFAVCAMLLYRNYFAALMRVKSGNVRLPAYVMQTCVGCLLALVIAGAVFAGIIRPLNPPTSELKLITKLEQMDSLEVLGVFSVRHLLDPSITSSLLSPNMTFADNALKEDENKKEFEGEDGQAEDKKDEQDEEDSRETEETDPNRETQSQMIWYKLQKINIPWLVIIICAVVAALALLRRYMRISWRKKVRQLGRESGVINYYRFFLKCLSKIGYRKPVNHTLYEYAANMEHQMQAFVQGDSTFGKLTDVYIQVVYGEKCVTQEEWNSFELFYDGFHKNIRKEIGVFKYLLKYLFL